MTHIARHCWKGRFSVESKTVNSAAVKPEVVGQEEEEGMLEGTVKTVSEAWRRRSTASSLDRSDVQQAAKEICTKMANPTRGSWNMLKNACRYLRGVEKVTWVMRAWKRHGVTVDVHVDSDWAKRTRKEVDEQRHDDGQRHSGETLVENEGFTCAEHGRSRRPRDRNGSG